MLLDAALIWFLFKRKINVARFAFFGVAAFVAIMFLLYIRSGSNHSMWELAEKTLAGRDLMDILYFAWVRQKTGIGEETVALPDGVATVGALVDWLRGRGPGFAAAFADEGVVRAAVNQVHAPLDAAVGDGDEVAFFPPVTGG